MHILSRKMLREFWAAHPDAEASLRGWHKTAKAAAWGSSAAVRRDFPSADQVGTRTVFNIGGNKYRLIAVIHFDRGRVYVRHVLTHAEYDRGRWKDK
ncbi:MAG: type II toxin-antitoxin system HigB family toxin [Planctomycetes bacterium]|nr:type II toxin-antitoxin system HigB family toxin [Planctomycetota bacterium]